MKIKTRLFSPVLLTALLTSALAMAATVAHPDGTYRGGYIDPRQIEVEFVLKEGKFASFKFRALGYKDQSYLKSEDKAMQGIAEQFQALADYLIGKDLTALHDLYFPGNIAKDTDAFTAATMRSAKMISAINDALNRGLYALPKE